MKEEREAYYCEMENPNDDIYQEILVKEKGNTTNMNMNMKKIVIVKPFVEGGLTGLWVSSQNHVLGAALYYTASHVHDSHFQKQTMHLQTTFAALLKEFPTLALVNVASKTVKFGSFEVMRGKLYDANNGVPLSIYQEACCGALAGAAEEFVLGPTRLAYMRTKANIGTHGAVEPFNCRNAFHALNSIYVKEGFSALWKGATSNAKGDMLYNMIMFTSYNRSISYFRDSLCLDTKRAQFGASVVSGFLTPAIYLPYARVQTQMRNMRPNEDGKNPGSNSLDYVLKILKLRGPSFFFIGFPKFVAPHCISVMITWMYWEHIRKVGESYGWWN